MEVGVIKMIPGRKGSCVIFSAFYVQFRFRSRSVPDGDHHSSRLYHVIAESGYLSLSL